MSGTALDAHGRLGRVAVLPVDVAGPGKVFVLDAKQLFLERYEGFREYPVHLVRGLSDSQLRHSPNGVLNPIC